MGFKHYQSIDYTQTAKEVLKSWSEKNVFKRSIDEKPAPKGDFVFYEGPPSANGKPGIHHVIGRTIKDVFCRYKSLSGYRVPRIAGWDTHGLPVELGVEKELGIKKDDIGSKISVEDYNKECKEAVMRYQSIWEDLTEKMGYWVDLKAPYITYESKYMETVWWLLGRLYEKGLLYKGHTIQPYSPMAGTGLSSHELNQPGCYRDVKDQTAVGQFKLTPESAKKLHLDEDLPTYFLAWTTTPWTLPANTALCVGPKIDYKAVRTVNKYTNEPMVVVLAASRVSAYFKDSTTGEEFETLEADKKPSHYVELKTFKGKELENLSYEQLIPIAKPDGNAFKVLSDNFVTTDDGTGIVHMAPCYGADDNRIAKMAGISSLDIVKSDGTYESFMGQFAGEAVKAEYLDEKVTSEKGFKPLDVKIVIYLKEHNRLFHAEKYVHSYPHCWRTDKPILYFPLESWFIKTTALKDRLTELNATINWQPESTGTGRFGNWLENLVDWNLSRSRFWGIPLPIWVSENGEEKKVISSVGELKREIDRSVAAGHMPENFLKNFNDNDMSDENYSLVDLHRTTVDKVVLVSESGTPLKRENDIIDVWFDSGAMPYAKLHYPFENKDKLDEAFPADFIAEGVDQTRGWFFTLHAIATLCFDSVAFKNVVSNGLVLDKDGQKMSKRLGNTIEPFETLEKYGPDAVRWYMMVNAQPWDNMRFDLAGVEEVKRKFFGTLFNTYNFFSLYANIDGFNHTTRKVPVNKLSRLDKWILSELSETVSSVRAHLDDYNPTKAARQISDFTTEKLSNWYVRLNRKRFWRGELDEDKIAAYQTLYHCLETLSRLIAPFAPMYADRLYVDLNEGFGGDMEDSVHLDTFPESDISLVDETLQTTMRSAQKVTSIVLSLREKANIRVRQPLGKVLLPVKDAQTRKMLEGAVPYILSETNVKEVEYLEPNSEILVRKIKPNFKTLGKKLGKDMKAAVPLISAFTSSQMEVLESGSTLELKVGESTYEITADDVDISFVDVPGLLISSSGGFTAALDTKIDDSLFEEGVARELVNRIQNLRKDSGFEVTDRITIQIEGNDVVQRTLEKHGEFMAGETLADHISVVAKASEAAVKVEFDDVKTSLLVSKVEN